MESFSSEELLEFIDQSPTCFHVVHTLKNILDTQGFEQLQESGEWVLKNGGKYYDSTGNESIATYRGRNL